jgi:predicted nucleic acid-binding protein
MKLIDSSSWIEALRQSGDPAVKARVDSLMRSGRAAWCDMVRIELWNGARGQTERRVLELYDDTLELLPTTDAVWSKARELAQRSRAKGLTVPSADLVIAACAWEHGVEMEHDDTHLDALAALFG